MANGKEYKDMLLTKSSGWKGCFNNLPVTDDKGETINYTIEEENIYPITGEDTVLTYATAITGTAKKGFTITNTHTPATVEVSGSKIWEDTLNIHQKRPDSIMVRLRANGKQAAVKTVTAEDGWRYTFTNLPKLDNGQAITYTVSEDAIDDYTSQIKGTDITNTRDGSTLGTTQINVVKYWDDGNNADGIRPDSIQVELLVNEESQEPQQLIELNDNNSWMGSFKKLPVKDASGNKITYSIQEIMTGSVTGTDGDYTYSSQVTKDGTNDYTIINKHTPVTTSLSGSKTWDDSFNIKKTRPDSIVVRLYANGREKAVKVVTADDDWKWTFTNLPVNEGGTKISYTVSEDAVSGYTCKISGMNITNTLKKDDGGHKKKDDTEKILVIPPFFITPTPTPEEGSTGGGNSGSDQISIVSLDKAAGGGLCKITYVLNGGSYNGSKADIVEYYAAGTVITIHEAPVRSGHKFLYWKGSSYMPGDRYTVTADHTFTAIWDDSRALGTDIPDTGDYTHTKGWAAVMAVCLSVLGVMFVTRRKKRRK